jgi:hypothetical protein
MLTRQAAQKLSEYLNHARGLHVMPDCDVCDSKPIFGGSLVVMVQGGRMPCMADPYVNTEDACRSVVYKYTGIPERRDQPPPYTAAATDNEAFDRTKALEMSGERAILKKCIHFLFFQSSEISSILNCTFPFAVLRAQNERRSEFVIGEIRDVLIESKEARRNDNVYIIDGPEFVPVGNVARIIKNVADSNERNIMLLTCYSVPSNRLLGVENIYDFLQPVCGTRRMNFDPGEMPLPVFDEDSERYACPPQGPLIYFKYG